MADRGDARLPFQENIISSSNIDDVLRLLHNQKLAISPKPSMWEYSPKGGMPKELAKLNPSRFLTRPLEKSLCFLPKDILVRICSMLSVRDFVGLSLTCRFLHWRMFTFCTCYAPYTVTVVVKDDIVIDFDFEKILNCINCSSPILEYTCNNERRGLYIIEQPFCLRKPFFFDTANVGLIFPSYSKDFYDRCLPYVMAIRGLARDLNLTFVSPYELPKKPYFHFPSTNDFLMATNASYYNYISRREIDGTLIPERNNMDIFRNCPYARQMKRVFVVSYSLETSPLNMPLFENSIGVYHAVESSVMATLKSIFAGSTNVIFHEYYGYGRINGRTPIYEYLFEKYGEFQELFIAQKAQNSIYYDFHIWSKVIATENGELLRILIRKAVEDYDCLTIGKVERFFEMNVKYGGMPFYCPGTFYWEMETALEPDEVEEKQKLEEVEKSKKAVEPDVAMELDEVEEEQKLDEGEERGKIEEEQKLEEVEESKKAMELDEVEEEQGPSVVCHFCSIL